MIRIVERYIFGSFLAAFMFAFVVLSAALSVGGLGESVKLVGRGMSPLLVLRLCVLALPEVLTWSVPLAALVYYLFPVIPLFAAGLALDGDRAVLRKMMPWCVGVSCFVLIGALAGGMLFTDKMEGEKTKFGVVENHYAHDGTTDEAVRISADGARPQLDLLSRHGVRATAFCTRTFAVRSPETVRRLVADGHEVAAHGLGHSNPGDPRQCREELERICGCPVVGYRSLRMAAIDEAALAAAGFRYDASLNPTFMPGRYCHLTSPRTPFVMKELCEVPASVTPLLRLPLFWLSLHLLPERLYRALARRTLAHDGSLVLYFHPWEFSPELQRLAVGRWSEQFGHSPDCILLVLASLPYDTADYIRSYDEFIAWKKRVGG